MRRTNGLEASTAEIRGGRRGTFASAASSR